MSQQDDFLKKAKILRLATADSNGNLHVVPVWFLYSAKKFYIGTNSRTQKAKNLKKNKKVAFCIDEGVNAPKIYGVMGQGLVKLIHEDSKVKKIAIRILLRYFKSIKTKSAKELLEDTDCIIEISPKKMTKWKY